VTISEVAPARVPGPTGELNSGSGPLTSGHDSEVTLTIEDPFAATLRNDPNIGNLIVKTNFQEWNHKGDLDPTETYNTVNAGDQNGDFLEAQVNVFIYVDGIEFQAVTAGDAELDDWTPDSASGLMFATIGFADIYMVSDGITTLATYMAVSGQEPFSGDSWVVRYEDTTGGNEQARYVVFETEAFDPGNPGIIVDGDIVNPDAIYGTEGTDYLTGNDGDDVIMGRAGNDTLDGGDGNDILVGGDGEDFLFGGGGDDNLAGGTGVDHFGYLASSGEGHDTINDFNVGDGNNVGGDFLSFTDLLDLDGDTDIDGDDLALFTDSVSVVNDGTDLTLNIPNAGDPANPTVVTLAGVGSDYDPGFNGTLNELINTLDITDNQINVDTYAS
jgi:Ca2+-binding RTX toxin-like protein